MLLSARFALVVGLSAGLSAAVPVAFALDPPHKQDQNKQKQPTKADSNKKKAEPAKKEAPAAAEGDRLDRRNARMRERNQEIDGLLTKPK
jgi:hypothetical protein